MQHIWGTFYLEAKYWLENIDSGHVSTVCVIIDRYKSKKCEIPDMWDDFDSVPNSEDSGLECIQIMQEKLSIIDSRSPND
jgi:hypothetical protein